MSFITFTLDSALRSQFSTLMDELWQVAVRIIWDVGNSRFEALSWLSKTLFILRTQIVSCWLRMALLELLCRFDMLPVATFDSCEELRLIWLSHNGINISKVNISLVLVINYSNPRLWVLFENPLLFSLYFLLLEEPI